MIDMNKRYRTRDGRDVRILCTDGPGPRPVIGIIDGSRGPAHWSADGIPGGYMEYGGDPARSQLVEVRTAEDVVREAMKHTSKGSWTQRAVAAVTALRDAGMLKEGE